MKISKLLAEVRLREPDSAVGLVVLMQNEKAVRMAAAFSMMPAPHFVIPADSRLAEAIEEELIETLDAVTILDLLWECARVEMRDLAARAGINLMETARAVFYELRTNFMIYPDGTLHSRASEYLRSLTNPPKEVEPEAVE